MKQRIGFALAAAGLLALAAAGCGGGGGGGTAAPTPAQSRAVAQAAVQETLRGGGILSRIGNLLTGLGSVRSRALRSRATQQFTFDGGFGTLTTGDPVVNGNVTTMAFTGEVHFEPGVGTLTISNGSLSIDNRGTRDNPNDDLITFHADFSGTMNDGTSTANVTGTMHLSVDSRAGTGTATTTMTATLGGESVTLGQSISMNMMAETMSVTQSIQSGNEKVTLTTTNAADRSGTVVLTYEAPQTVLRISLNLSANGNGTGTVTLNGYQVGTVAVTTNPTSGTVTMTITYPDGETQTFDVTPVAG